MFLKHGSSAEIGTTRASMNRTHKTNAAKGVDKGYNEYKEFHGRETDRGTYMCSIYGNG